MRNQPFKKIHFDLPINAQVGVDRLDIQGDADFVWTEIPMPAHVGKVELCRLNMALGMTLSAARVKFERAVLGQILSVAESDIGLNEPSFQAVAVRGIRGFFEEAIPAGRFSFSQGIDFFRNTDRYHTKIMLDGSFSGEFHILTVGHSVMNSLLGANVAEHLIGKLGLHGMPAATVAPVPLFISTHLVNAISPTMTDSPRRLFAQAKSLEFLGALAEHFGGSDESPIKYDSKARQRAHAVQEELVSHGGKLPTLDELAERHGRSAKLLNDEFTREFGQSIYSFISNHRLQLAHDQIQSGGVSIKSLAAELGYSHVSNFTIAFKRKFGYPPGAARKQNHL